MSVGGAAPSPLLDPMVVGWLLLLLSLLLDSTRAVGSSSSLSLGQHPMYRALGPSVDKKKLSSTKIVWEPNSALEAYDAPLPAT